MLVTLDAKELLAAARLAYDKDQIRSWCKCLLIKVRYDKYTIVGSDGYKLIEFEHKVNYDAADVSEKHNADFLLYVEDVKNDFNCKTMKQAENHIDFLKGKRNREF